MAMNKTFRFSEKQIQQLQSIAIERTGKTGQWTSITTIVREAIDAYCNKQEAIVRGLIAAKQGGNNE